MLFVSIFTDGIKTERTAWAYWKCVTTATEECQTDFTAELCNLQRHGSAWSVHCVCRWNEKGLYFFCSPLGVDKCAKAAMLVSPCLGEITDVSGAAERCGETGAQQMWGLVRNFICHCTLQQTSLLIGSPWITLGTWTLCSWMDRTDVRLCSHCHTHSRTETRTLLLIC